MATVGLPAGFWLQHASREADELLAFADELAATPEGRPGVVIAPLNAADRVDALYRAARGSGAAILDPQGHLIDRKHTKRAERHFPWLAENPRPTDVSAWKAWMQRALDHQTARPGADPPNVVITASPIIQADRGQDELYRILDAAHDVAGGAGDDCWLGVNVDRTYLRDDAHLTRLGDALVAASPRGVVLRGFHRELAPVTDRDYLLGLRELISALSTNGVPVLLPNAGWLGWLAMSWGAWGFTAGMAAGTWADREPSPVTRPDEPAQLYFEPQLLRPVRWRVHRELVGDPNYQPCPCPDCQQMGDTYDPHLAKRHQMRLAHQEAARLVPYGGGLRAGAVAARIDQAVAFRDDLPKAVRSRANAEFLDRWRDLV